MKSIVLFILVLQAFFTNPSFAQGPQPVKFGKLTFQKDGVFALFGGTGTPDTEEAKRSNAEARNVIKEMRQSKAHPFTWQASAPEGVTFIFPIDGELRDIHEALKQYSKGPKPSWVWMGFSSSTPVTIKVYLDPKGDGHIDLYQSEQLIGYMPCKSGLRSKQPHAGNWSVKEKCTESEVGELGRMSRKWNSWMSWALEIENTNPGCYIHGGSLMSPSDGCVRVARPGARIIYEIVKTGSKIVITYL